jgi:hypothetical protein
MQSNADPLNKDQFYFVTCPHCMGLIGVLKSELNCRIFRHAILKSTLQPINPHATKEICDALIQNNLIYGCGKPFFINEKVEAVICDYI